MPEQQVTKASDSVRKTCPVSLLGGRNAVSGGKPASRGADLLEAVVAAKALQPLHQGAGEGHIRGVILQRHQVYWARVSGHQAAMQGDGSGAHAAVQARMSWLQLLLPMRRSVKQRRCQHNLTKMACRVCAPAPNGAAGPVLLWAAWMHPPASSKSSRQSSAASHQLHVATLHRSGCVVPHDEDTNTWCPCSSNLQQGLDELLGTLGQLCEVRPREIHLEGEQRLECLLACDILAPCKCQDTVIQCSKHDDLQVYSICPCSCKCQ